MTSLLRLRAGLPQVVRAGGCSLRINRWPGIDGTAQLGPVPGDAPPTAALIRTAVDDLGALGFEDVLTTALLRSEHGPFLEAGFSERDRLALLRRELVGPLPARVAGVRVRTPRRREWVDLAAVDVRAFPPGWATDAQGVAEAAAATPWSRVRAVGHPAVGYAIAGRSRQRGYLQRLAVEPRASRRGIGRALVVDALSWLTAKGATEVLVNTQETNAAALRLYARLGFTVLPEGLTVLGRPVGPTP